MREMEYCCSFSAMLRIGGRKSKFGYSKIKLWVRVIVDNLDNYYFMQEIRSIDIFNEVSQI